MLPRRDGAAAPSNDLPLAGTRVVDVTTNVAGPYAALILADLGADVIKIEPPQGDDSRRMAPVVDDSSAFFLALNRNKRSAVLDLKLESARERLDAELGQADVLLTNLRPNQREAFGLESSSLRERFPQLVIGELSAYGVGPEAARPGYDAVLQARTGLMALTGERGGPPVRVGVSILDMGSGTWLALGVLAALNRRERTDRGGVVEGSLLETGVAAVAYHLAALQISGETPGPTGTEHPAFAPYGLFAAADGYVMIGVGSDAIFARLCEALGRPAWAHDARFDTNSQRVSNRHALQAEIEGVLRTGTSAECLQRLLAADVPADRVSSIDQVLSDEQVAACDVWLDVPFTSDPSAPSVRLPGLPLRFDSIRPPVRRPPPRRGEHSVEVGSVSEGYMA